MDFPRGSEWRKWDLHLHAPGTKLSNGYAEKDGKPDWERFCSAIHDSDVYAFGITDYFSLDHYFEFRDHYSRLYPEDLKVFFPNLELRLTEAVNKDGESVNIHVIFRPDLSQNDAQKFLGSLQTETTIGTSKKPVTCSDMKQETEFASATVTRDAIDHALQWTFGGGLPMEEFALVIASAKSGGIRSGGPSKSRKDQLVDEIDKMCDGFFGGPGSTGHYLNEDRLESSDKVPAKPVFDGCDAHSFDELEAKLGKHNSTVEPLHHTTWIKADLTYEGLLQTLVEPKHRVAIQANEPDTKQPYQYISSIGFSDTSDFPKEIVFNRNLNSIIGSRSTGKSALLAYIAHAVDPDYTIEQQADAFDISQEKTGPAAGKTWLDVASTKCEVRWGEKDTKTGKVIYIPQNSLNSLSRQPEKVNQKIVPALFRKYPDFEAIFDKSETDLQAANSRARSGTHGWFAAAREVDSLKDEINELGDKDAVIATRDALMARIEEVRSRSTMSEQELADYLQVSSDIEARRTRMSVIGDDLRTLNQYASLTDQGVESIPDSVQVSINVFPAPSQMPEGLHERFSQAIDDTASALTRELEGEIRTQLETESGESQRLVNEIETLVVENAELIAKHASNAELEAVTKDYDKQVLLLDQIEKKEESLGRLVDTMGEELEKVANGIANREEVFVDLKRQFESSPKDLDDLIFGLEIGLDEAARSASSSAFNRSKTSEFIASKGDDVNVEKAQNDPQKFLQALKSGAQSLNRGSNPEAVALSVLLLKKEVRFTAELDSDIIGGFGTSTMTPGKQALFALTLILNESQEPWPLLIDQPEDDLDSRSIYDSIVPYLVDRKRERQIIMVSHNPNLVLGADSEEVIVANRHGRDSPNYDERTFEYLSGSLEHTQPMNEGSPTILGRSGIREHACILLDGGQEAFEKRREKYNLKG